MGIGAGLFEDPTQTADIGIVPRPMSEIDAGNVEVVLRLVPCGVRQLPLIFCLLLSLAGAVTFGHRPRAFLCAGAFRAHRPHPLPTPDAQPCELLTPIPAIRVSMTALPAAKAAFCRRTSLRST